MLNDDEAYESDTDKDVNDEENEGPEKEAPCQQEEHMEDEGYGTCVRDMMSIRIHCLFLMMYYLKE